MSQQAEHQDLVARPVVEVMSHPVFSVTADLLLGDALAAMVRTGRRHIAVVDDDLRCRGVIGDRAVAAAWAHDPTALTRMMVGQLLEPRPSIVGSDATVRDVARAMYLDGVDAVAVIDRTGTPIGMVTGGDLVALMATQVDADTVDAEPVDAEPVDAEPVIVEPFGAYEDEFELLISETPD
jgi:CBS domain-containing protein